jgi:dolichol-phosphate mannosyltransferase
MQGTPVLAICAPMYREAAIVPEFVERTRRAGAATGLPFVVYVADDASPDGTLAALQAAVDAWPQGSPGRLQPVPLARNAGQLGATLAALRAALDAGAEHIVVLDGDLQDPPETIPALVAAACADPAVAAVFAVKASRRDALWMRLGVVGYRWILRGLGSSAPPAGAGAFCVLGPALAARLVALPPQQANLAPLVAALADGPLATVPYDKAERYDGPSRVGVLGLAREAWGSWVLAGAAERGAALVAMAVCVVGVTAESAPMALAALVPAVVAVAARRRRRAAGL